MAEGIVNLRKTATTSFSEGAGRRVFSALKEDFLRVSYVKHIENHMLVIKEIILRPVEVIQQVPLGIRAMKS